MTGWLFNQPNFIIFWNYSSQMGPWVQKKYLPEKDSLSVSFSSHGHCHLIRNNPKCVRILLIPKYRKIHSFLVLYKSFVHCIPLRSSNNEASDIRYSYFGNYFRLTILGLFSHLFILPLLFVGEYCPHSELPGLVSVYGGCVPWP